MDWTSLRTSYNLDRVGLGQSTTKGKQTQHQVNQYNHVVVIIISYHTQNPITISRRWPPESSGRNLSGSMQQRGMHQ